MPVLRQGPLPASARTQGLSATVDTGGTLVGEASPNAIIEVHNLSEAPTGSRVVEDGVEIARAGADGRFQAKVTGALPGDVLQVQVREPGKPVTTAIQLRVDASRSQGDPRAAFVNLSRVGASFDGQAVELSTRTRQPVTEPDATVRFTNTRTKAFVDVVADPLGRLPATSLAANAGDQIDVRVSDGTVALDTVPSLGTITVPTTSTAPVQPAHQKKDYGLQLLALNGPLIQPSGPGYGRQGSIGNCPVPAAAAAVAAVDPDAVRNLIKENKDGTYTVTFHPANKPPVEIVVDNQVWGRGGRPTYGTGGSSNGVVESWFPLVEKAYAAYVGDYEILGAGTSVGTVLSEMTGRATTATFTNVTSLDDVWRELQRGAGNALAMAGGTYGSSEQSRYRGSGVYANHAYSVMGIEEQNGRRLVTLRNPWGSGTPSGGMPDGIFQMKLEDFCHLFQVLNVS